MTSIGRFNSLNSTAFQPMVDAAALQSQQQLLLAAVQSLDLQGPELGAAARALLATTPMALPLAAGVAQVSNPFAALSVMDPRALAALSELNELQGPLPSNAWAPAEELAANLDALYGAGGAMLGNQWDVAAQQGVVGLLAALAGAPLESVAAMLGGGPDALDVAGRLMGAATALASPDMPASDVADAMLAAEMALARRATRNGGDAKQIRNLLQRHVGVGRSGFAGGQYSGQGALGNVAGSRRPDVTAPPAGAFRADNPGAAAGMALEAARSQVGVREATGNNDGIPSQRFMNGRQEPWCANFVAWSFRQTGHPLPGNQRSLASVQYMEDQMKGAGKWSPRQAAQPKPGDIIFFANRGASDRGGGRHVGMVEKVENGRVYTIEGNSGNQVARRSYALGNARISGYGRP